MNGEHITIKKFLTGVKSQCFLTWADKTNLNQNRVPLTFYRFLMNLIGIVRSNKKIYCASFPCTMQTKADVNSANKLI